MTSTNGTRVSTRTTAGEVQPRRLGPRACTICPPGAIEGCFRCGAKYGHRHIVVQARDGSTLGRVAACEHHAPSGDVMPSQGPELVVRATSREANAVQDEAKRQRDRERRRAQRVVLERHAHEVAEVLADIRAGAS